MTSYENRGLLYGMTVTLIEANRLPLVSMRLVLPLAGSAGDPHGKEGVAEMVGSLINEGTLTQNAVQFAERIEDIGASIGVSVGADSMTISVFVLKEHADAALALVSEILRGPAYLRRRPAELRPHSRRGPAGPRGAEG